MDSAGTVQESVAGEPSEARPDERGASLVEYALLVALIALVCIIAVMFFGTETSESFSRTANSITNS